MNTGASPMDDKYFKKAMEEYIELNRSNLSLMFLDLCPSAQSWVLMRAQVFKTEDQKKPVEVSL
jgi:hypothetical protein